MSRNAESRFAVNPTNLDMSRSKFKRPHSVKTTFNVGELIPFYYPPDTRAAAVCCQAMSHRNVL